MAHWRAAPFAAPLCKAVVDGDIAGLAAHVARGEDPNQEECGRLPAELAVEFKSDSALDALLAAGAGRFSCKNGNNHGYSLAALAVAWDWPQGLDILRAHGTEMFSKSFEGYGSPLRNAAIYSRAACARKLIGWGAAAEPWGSMWDGRGHPPMGWCAMRGALKIARLLHKANPALLDAPASVGRRPVHLAAANGRLDFLAWLSKSGADMGALDDEGKSALGYAREEGQQKVIHLLGAIAARAQAQEIGEAAGGPGQLDPTAAARKPRL